MKMQRIAAVGKGTSLLLACVALTLWSQGGREGAAAGIELCLGVLVPSLFPFMALTNLFVRTGLCQSCGRILRKPSRRLFGLSGALAPVILLSLLGGYPVGAGGIAALRGQRVISAREAAHAALFAVCAGPGFVVSFVGGSVYGSTEIGLVLFASQSLSVLLTGIAAKPLAPKEAENYSDIENKSAILPFSQALVEAVTAAARGMLTICAFVVLFSAMTGILAQLIPREVPLTAAYVLLEVCGAVNRCAPTQPIAVVAFAVGFGGLCVHCQLFAALGEVKVNKVLFFVFRIIQGLLTAGFTALGLHLLPRKAAVFSTAESGTPALTGGSLLTGAVLLAVLLCFFISVRQTLKKT